MGGVPGARYNGDGRAWLKFRHVIRIQRLTIAMRNLGAAVERMISDEA